MQRKNKGAAPKDYTPLTNGTKIDKIKNIYKVLSYFQYKVGTTLDCSKSTGILRNCVTWYVKDLERENMLQAIFRKKDINTGYKAKHYSADKSLWHKRPHELSLFGESEASI
jgi:hypothetical protein